MNPGNCVFPFSARNRAKKGCRKPKWPKQQNQYFAISGPWVVPLVPGSAKMESVRKLRNFREKLLGRPYFFLKSASSSGKLRFSVSRPEFLQVPRAVPGLKNQYFGISRPWVGQTVKLKKVAHFRGETFGAAGFPPPKVPLAPGNCIFQKLFPRKSRKTIPDSVATFFFDLGTPVALRTRKGPAGLVGCLLARRAGSTLVS